MIIFNSAMRYEGVVYRPPSEANSLLIQATIGCPHNKCAFCAMYKGVKFRVRPVEEIKEDLAQAWNTYGRYVKTIFFPDGNTIAMRTEKLEEIFKYASSIFSNLQRITVYGGAKFVRVKSVEDLKRLKEAGLRRIHMGMESGDDVTLEKMHKGVTAEQTIEAGRKVIEAGLELSEYYMVGLGGLERTAEHALESARVLNAINPTFIRLRTTVPIPGTELYEMFEKGEWTLLSPHQALKEIKMLIENLTCESILVSDHNSNFWDIEGKLPDDKEKMLAEIERALEVDESRFRPYWAVRL